MKETIKQLLSRLPWLKNFLLRIKSVVGYGSDFRTGISKRYIAGNGIEIGALHNPLNYSRSHAHVKYVDRLSVEKLRQHYPELSREKLVNLDLIDDGEILSTLDNNSLDFIIANHLLEHCKNPIRTIMNHLNKIKPGGILFYAIPDKRYTFDVNREETTYEHLMDDYHEKDDHYRHYLEWAKYCNNISNDIETSERANQLMKMGYSIHFHTWTAQSFLDFIYRTRNFDGQTNAYDIECFVQNNSEIIVVLRKI